MPTLQLCAYKDELPRNADDWFWGGGVFDRLGRFAGLGQEMETIALRQPRRLSRPAVQIDGQPTPPSS